MTTARRTRRRERVRPITTIGSRVLPVSAAVAVGLGCASPPPSSTPDASHVAAVATARASSSSIVFAPDHATLWLTSPDDDAVVQIDALTLAEVRRVVVAGAPEQLALRGNTLVITLARGTDVALLDTASAVPSVVRVPVPCGGTRGVAVVPDASAHAFVTCPADDTLVEIDVAAHRVLRAIASPGRPTALAIAGDALYASASRTGTVRTFSLARIAALPARTDDTRWPDAIATSDVQVHERVLPSDAGHASEQLDALVAIDGTGGVAGAYQRVEHDGDRDRPASQGSYGSVVDGAPRIEPRLTGACGGRYAVFDGGANVFSGPSAIAYDSAHGRMWVANRSTDNVAVLACRTDGSEVASDVLAPVASAWRVGRGPRGIVLADDGASAFVDVGYDHAVARIALDASASASTDGATVHDASPVRRREMGTSIFTDEALRGRNLFDDAVDTHLTPSGIVTCATCHPGGGDDGVTWFLHTPNVPRKLRRSPAAWAARPSLAPFHWDGSFADAATLTHTTIVELMGGDALLVDTSAVAAWLATIPPPVPRPLDSTQQVRAAHGRALFESSAVGCASCHSTSVFSDGMRHAVLGASSDPDGVLGLADTPTLLGVRARPPFLHDGRAATLTEVLTTHNAGDTHGHTSQLTPDEVSDVVWYLQTL